MSVNFSLQLCIDPNRVCPASACALGRQLVIIWRHQEQKDWSFPKLCSRMSFPESNCTVTNKTDAEKPEQTDYWHYKLIIPCTSNLSPPIKWIASLFVFAFAKTCFSTWLFQPSLAYPEPFTPSGFHPALPQRLGSAKKWNTLYFCMSSSKLSHLSGNWEIAKVCSR